MWNSATLRHLAWLAALYLLEVTLASRMGSWNPPLVMMGVVAIALESGATSGLIWGFLAGLLMEPYLAGALGASSAGLALIGYATGAISSKMFGESLWIRLLWPCVALLGVSWFEAGWGRPAGADLSLWEALAAALPPSRWISTAVVAPWGREAMRRKKNRPRLKRIYS